MKEGLKARLMVNALIAFLQGLGVNADLRQDGEPGMEFEKGVWKMAKLCQNEVTIGFQGMLVAYQINPNLIADGVWGEETTNTIKRLKKLAASEPALQ